MDLSQVILVPVNHQSFLLNLFEFVEPEIFEGTEEVSEERSWTEGGNGNELTSTINWDTTDPLEK